MWLTRESLQNFIIITAMSLIVTSALPAFKKGNLTNTQSSQNISWIPEMRLLHHLLKECKENSSVSKTSSTVNMWQCLKMTSLNIIDDMTRRQIVPIWRGVRFIQITDTKDNHKSSRINRNHFWQRKDLQYLTWFDRLALTFTKMLNTHILEINLKELTDAYVENIKRKDLFLSYNSSDAVGTARHRRHRFNMMVTMMFGVTALGAVLVPMGFQMLSIVSGKALLLAKMALLLASINGLKRVANSGLHYGLYHVPGEHYANYYDRGDIHHPRNVQSVATLIDQPIETGLIV